MDWYILTKTARLNEIGKQLQAEPIYTKNIPATVVSYSKYIYDQSLPERPAIPSFKKVRGAKVTDWVNTIRTSTGYSLISEKLFECLSSFNLASYRGYDTLLLDNKKEYKYQLFLQSVQTSLIDYSKSTFCTYEKNELTEKYEYRIKKGISSYQDTIVANARYGQSIFLKEDILFDGFLMPVGPVVFLVNQKVKKAIIDGGFTVLCLIPFQDGEDFVTEDLHTKVLRVEKE